MKNQGNSPYANLDDKGLRDEARTALDGGDYATARRLFGALAAREDAGDLAYEAKKAFNDLRIDRRAIWVGLFTVLIYATGWLVALSRV